MKRLSFFLALATSLLFCSCQNKQYNCFDASDNSTYLEFGSMTFETAILNLYSAAGVPLLDTSIYTYDQYPYDKWEAVEWHWRRYNYLSIYENYFKSINNYGDFLSDESDCNQGKEPLKDFICRYTHDEKFRKSRIKIEGRDTDSIFTRSANQNFKFYFEFGVTKSWDELSYLRARFIATAAMDVTESFYFSRIDDKWYLTDYFDYGDIWD